MLADEFGTASNIKSRVNRLSVLGAITSVQHRLKLYTKVPPNGLVIYCGTIVTEEGKEKKVNIDFEPFKPINTSLYLCDNKFHTEALSALLADDNKFGFIVMDGNGALFGTLQGNTREVLHKFPVDLPKKHGFYPFLNHFFGFLSINIFSNFDERTRRSISTSFREITNGKTS
jgi:peptide chain release factor subunit 1